MEDKRRNIQMERRKVRKRRKHRRLVSKIIRFAYVIVGIVICFIVLHKTKEQAIQLLVQNSLNKLEEKHEVETETVVNAKEEEVHNKGYDLDNSDVELDKQLKLLAKKDSDIKKILDNREDYPDDVLNLLVKNSETKQFVLDYPKKKNKETSIDISGEVKQEVPLFLQWDERWGYSIYGDEIMAIDGCGPTCLSMVATSILGDTSMNPYWMAQYSEEKGYITDGATSWTFMSEGASLLGLDVTEIPLDEQRVADNLNVGNPIICIMGPGDFTTSGHYIVLTSYKDGKVKINDPNSMERSSKEWSFKEISNQIRNLWVYR